VILGVMKLGFIKLGNCVTGQLNFNKSFKNLMAKGGKVNKMERYGVLVNLVQMLGGFPYFTLLLKKKCS